MQGIFSFMLFSSIFIFVCWLVLHAIVSLLHKHANKNARRSVNYIVIGVAAGIYFPVTLLIVFAILFVLIVTEEEDRD